MLSLPNCLNKTTVHHLAQVPAGSGDGAGAEAGAGEDGGAGADLPGAQAPAGRPAQETTLYHNIMLNRRQRCQFLYSDFSTDCPSAWRDVSTLSRIRTEAFEIKMKPIIVNEEPSRKVGTNFFP